ncbi:hypothetical protein DRN85_09345 [Methanosarcinales archaeon]|nr:MAG: hypothetical protein DRN85_09345 [Methanosarcinales archaeon]
MTIALSTAFYAYFYLLTSKQGAIEAVSYEWNFNEGKTYGWTMVHGFSDVQITDEGLVTKVTDFDPYIYSPSVRISSEKQRRIIVALKVIGNASKLKIYWTSDVSPEWNEEKTMEILINPDGRLHEYVFDFGFGADRHPMWKGVITRFRFDLEPPDCYNTELLIHYVKIPVLTSDFKVKGPYFSTPIPTVSKYFKIALRIYNTGGEKLNLKLNFETTQSMEVLNGKTRDVQVDVDEDQYVSWILRTSSIGFYEARIEITSENSIANLTYLVKFPVFPEVDIKNKSWPTVSDGVTLMEDGGLLLRSQETLAYFVKSEIGYGPVLILLKDEEGWSPVGAFGAFASLSVVARNNLKERFYIIPNNVKVNEKIVEFTANNKAWIFSSVWELKNRSICVENHLRALKELNVTRLSIALYPGELGFSSSKTEALLPGLEWLVNGENSSNTLDIASPLNVRNAPNPIKVTIPLMAVRYNDSLIAILWDPHYSWDGKHSLMSLQFASPNWVEGQDNHLFMLFVPTVPMWVKENSDEAYQPYKLEAGGELNIKFRVYASKSNTVLDAVREWIRVYGLPKQDFPRSLDEELHLSMEAYLKSLWVPDEGWRHASGWTPAPYPGYALLLYLTCLVEKNQSFRDVLIDRFNESIQLAIKNRGPAYIASGEGCHIPGWQLPFHIGYLDKGLPSLRDYIYSLISSQDADGEWGFQPSKKTRMLGSPGAKEIGITATRATEILRWARITGDKVALSAGLKALKAMEKYFVPRAAQVWEIPVHTPDVLASAKALEAYLEAYRATGNQEYLERAKYWAYTGLPFIYLWSTYDRNVMLYSSIPVYGATFYKAPVWIGRPVQWCGLVYAYHLLKLSDYDDSFPWRAIGEGILSSAMRQQVASGSLAGTYPDSWDLITDTPYGPYINPESIVKCTLFLKGLDPDLNTLILREEQTNVTITTPAKIVCLNNTDTHLKLKLSFFEGKTIYVLIHGLNVKSVYKWSEEHRDYYPVDRVEDLNATAEGWQIIADGYIIIELRFPSENVELLIKRI